MRGVNVLYRLLLLVQGVSLGWDLSVTLVHVVVVVRRHCSEKLSLLPCVCVHY